MELTTEELRERVVKLLAVVDTERVHQHAFRASIDASIITKILAPESSSLELLELNQLTGFDDFDLRNLEHFEAEWNKEISVLTGNSSGDLTNDN